MIARHSHNPSSPKQGESGVSPPFHIIALVAACCVWVHSALTRPDRGTSAARKFGEEPPALAFERHGVPAVLHRIQNDHGGTVFHPGHAVDRGTPAFMRRR